MNLFQIILVAMAVLIVAIWAGNLPGKIEKSKKEKQQTKESIQKRKDIFQELNEDDKEEYVNFLTKLKYMDKIYVTDQGTVLNSKSHTFKDFINNQQLPSQLELVWEILGDNNIRISDIINLIENNAPYPMDAKVGIAMDYLKISPMQKKTMSVIKMYNQLINIDDEYPLYIEFTDMKNYREGYITVIYQSGYGYDDKNLGRARHARPTKY